MNKRTGTDIHSDKDLSHTARKFSSYRTDVAEKKRQLDWNFKQIANKVTRARKEMVNDIKRIESATLKVLEKEKDLAMKRINDVSKMMEKIYKR